MKKILLTGGLGYIGSHVSVELIERGYEVIIVDNLCNSSIKVLGQIKKITGIEPTFYEKDIRNKSDLLKIFKRHSIDCVIHFAGLKSLNESVDNPLAYYDNNLIGAINLLTIMAQVNCKSIVFSSSATVYGNAQDLPIKENAQLSASNPYGQSKLLIEKLLQDLHISDNDWNIAILRYFNPAGAHESGLIGDSPNGIPNNLFPYISRVANGKLKKLTIFGNDYDTHDGTGIRDYIHVVDLAKGHLKALEAIKSYPTVLVVNLGTGKGYSVLDVVREFEIASNQVIPYEFVSRRAGDVSECYADPTLAFQLLNWRANFKLDRMCQDSWSWEKNSLNDYDI
jgi:UDP-glucose 4-epimerase